MSAVHLSDQALVALVSRGDRDALAELYDRYSAAAYGLARRIVRDSTHAEDVVQEAFLAVWREARRFDARRARPSTWILSLVHHKAVDLVRRETIRSGPPLDDQPERAGGDDVPRDAWLSLQREQVAAALAELSDPHREVIELAYFAGYTQSELSDRLGQPIGTIKSRTHAALARLQEALAARGITTENPWSTQSSGI
jgi:RNA polymerase sigma factor (sigma-70 family)